MGCGEFNTRCLYEQCGDVMDVRLELPGPDTKELVDPCPELVAVEMLTAELADAQLNAPYVFALYSAPSRFVDWRVFSGNLPPGVALDSTLGILVGVPEAEGEFTFTVQATPQDPALPCHEPAEREYTLTVTAGCVEDENCMVGWPEQGPFTGCQDGVCVLSGLWCPETVMGTDVAWKAPEEPVGNEESGWLIVEHKKIPSSEQLSPKDPSNHVLTMEKEGELISFRYSLPESWPLPYRVGRTAGFKIGDNQTKVPADSILFWVDEWELPSLLFNGVMAAGLLEQMVVPGVPDLEFDRWPLDCPPEPDQVCGNVRPDALSVTSGGDPAFAVAGDPQGAKVDGHNLLLRVGSAYSHSAYAPEGCAGAMPDWASFFVYPLEAGPLAAISNNLSPGGSGGPQQQGCSQGQGSAGDHVVCHLGDAFINELPQAIFSANDSLTPSGIAVEGWTWRLEQPFHGFVKLEDQSDNGLYQSLQPSVCGNYQVLLHVEDEHGVSSCVEDMMEVIVKPLPDLDLRLELMWRSGERWEDSNDTASFLLIHPLAANKPLDSPGWVCMYDLDEQLSKNWTMANQQGPPGDCHLRRGEMAKGRAEVITVEELMPTAGGKSFPPYKVAVRAPETNSLAVSISLRVFFPGESAEPEYEIIDKVMPPGTVWSPGVIIVHENDKVFIKKMDWL